MHDQSVRAMIADHLGVAVDGVSDEDGVPVVELSVVTTNQDGTDVVSGYAAARLDA